MDEAQPFLPPRNQSASPIQNGSHHQNGYSRPPVPIIRTSTPPTPIPTPPPRVVAMYPKVPEIQPNNSPFQKNGTEPERPYSPSRASNALGEPFPSKNEFSSTNSVDNAIKEMDTTLKDIHDTLSSYENLWGWFQQLEKLILNYETA
jgi:hypothetical protein